MKKIILEGYIMYKNSKRTIALLCALLMLSGCGTTVENSANSDTPETASAAADTVQTEETAEETVDLYAELRGVNGEDQTVNILLRQEFTYEFMADEMIGEPINDTVYERNRATEELLNISLTFNPVPGSYSNQDQFKNAFTSSVLANDGSYNLVMCAANYMLPLTTKGYFRNLMKMPELSMDQPWYALNYIDSMQVANRLYLTAGSASINYLENMCVLFFNKNLMTDFGYTSPYDLVREGKWTYDELYALVDGAYRDTNGNGKVDETDTLGYLTYGNMINAQTVSMGHAYIVRNEEGIPGLAPEVSERTIDIYTKTEAFINQLEGTYFYNDAAKDALQTTDSMLTLWGSGNVMFFPQVLSTAGKMRDDKFDFGVVPLPKYDTEQAEYKSYVLENVTVMGIPSYQTDPISAQTLEALSIYGYDRLSHVYYDVVLKDKYSRDADTQEMLDLIAKSATFEYPIDTQFMANCIKDNIPFVSTFEKQHKMLSKSFEKIVKAWLELE